MSKPFNFEEFKAGKPAKSKLFDVTYNFRDIDESLTYPIICKVTNEIGATFIDSKTIKHLETYTTMLQTKRTVWIAICKHSEYGIEPDEAFYNSKEEAMNSRHEDLWKVIDAIPYEIEE